jgi:hypothetical protein
VCGSGRTATQWFGGASFAPNCVTPNGTRTQAETAASCHRKKVAQSEHATKIPLLASGRCGVEICPTARLAALSFVKDINNINHEPRRF